MSLTSSVRGKGKFTCTRSMCTPIIISAQSILVCQPMCNGSLKLVQLSSRISSQEGSEPHVSKTHHMAHLIPISITPEGQWQGNNISRTSMGPMVEIITCNATLAKMYAGMSGRAGHNRLDFDRDLDVQLHQDSLSLLDGAKTRFSLPTSDNSHNAANYNHNDPVNSPQHLLHTTATVTITWNNPDLVIQHIYILG